MSIGTHIAALWKRSRPFRVVSIGAALVSVLAIVSGVSRGGGTSFTQPTPPPTPPVQPNPTPSPNQSALVQCGPSGGTQLAAPLVVGSQQPSNVTAVGGAQQGGVPLEVVGRYTQFFVRVDAAKTEPRQGESCALMSGAIDLLQASDFAYADCFQDGQPKMTEAQRCADSHTLSESRFDRLVAAFAAIEDEKSSENTALLSEARRNMLPYDESRERWSEVAPIVAEAEQAQAAIDASDQRIARLVAAAQGAGEAPTPTQLVALAKASALDQLDISRLTSEQAKLLERARDAQEEIQDSDRRLDSLAVALGAVSTGTSEARADLISAVGVLRPLDAARASGDQEAVIARARSEAAGFAMRDLVTEATGFDAATTDAARHQKMVDLAAVVNDHGGVAEPTAEQQAALMAAQEAAASLARSDRRLAAMTSTIESVRAGGPAAISDEVRKSFEAITAFDASRMTEDQRRDYEDLADSRDIKAATDVGVLTRSVPIYLIAAGEGDKDLALDALITNLQRDGFNIVETEEASAVRFELSVGEFEMGGLTVGGTTVETARIDVLLTGAWVIGSDDLSPISAEGVGRGRNAKAKAVDEAIEQVSAAVKSMADEA